MAVSATARRQMKMENKKRARGEKKIQLWLPAELLKAAEYHAKRMQLETITGLVRSIIFREIGILESYKARDEKREEMGLDKLEAFPPHTEAAPLLDFLNMLDATDDDKASMEKLGSSLDDVHD